MFAPIRADLAIGARSMSRRRAYRGSHRATWSSPPRRLTVLRLRGAEPTRQTLPSGVGGKKEVHALTVDAGDRAILSRPNVLARSDRADVSLDSTRDRRFADVSPDTARFQDCPPAIRSLHDVFSSQPRRYLGIPVAPDNACLA